MSLNTTGRVPVTRCWCGHKHPVAKLLEMTLDKRAVYACQCSYRVEGEASPSTCLAHALAAGAVTAPGKTAVKATARS